MSCSYTRYWFALKSGELRTQEKRPSGRSSVAVITTRDERDSQHTTHRIVGSFNEATLEAWCGQDRGPRLEGMIRNMLGGAR